ncbi:hypothetical protein B0H13DRAFT_2355767 [Mycena leptocephala]|nr:hypothetical protein B0H13DRAFT_2355767 [Mycena leptocephala]
MTQLPPTAVASAAHFAAAATVPQSMTNNPYGQTQAPASQVSHPAIAVAAAAAATGTSRDGRCAYDRPLGRWRNLRRGPRGPLAIVPDNGEKWYAITKGRYVGVTNNLAIADAAVTRVSHALCASYSSQVDAVAAFNQALSMPFLNLIEIV